MLCYGKAGYGLMLLLVFFMFAGCERVTIQPDLTRTGYDYSPLSLGAYRIYDAYQINYNFAADNDTLTFQYKELVSEAFLNQEGDTTFVIHKLHRKAGDAFWKLDSVSHWRQTARQLIEHSNNKDVVRLVFPVAEGKIWDSNIYSSIQADSFRMVQVHKPFSYPEHEYEQTLTVIQRNIEDTIVRQDIRREVYAKGMGPVYRLTKNLNYCHTQDCYNMGIINSGLFREMRLTDYGKE